MRRCWIAVLLLLVGGAARAQTPDCDAMFAALAAALAAQDRAALERGGVAASQSVGCDADRRTVLRRQASAALAALAEQARAAGADATEMAARLLAARRAGGAWQTLRGLADLAFAARRHAEAAELYEATLRAIDDDEDLPAEPPPPPELRALLLRRANELMMLVPHIPDPQRDGSPGYPTATLVQGSGRGDVTVQAVLLPVTYVYGLPQMSPEGLAFARDWLDSVRHAGLAELVLVGHADPQVDQGLTAAQGAALNETLAVARARALGEFFRGNGFAGPIRVFGYGSRCTLPLTAEYDADEKNRILRRVEVLSAGALPAGYCNGLAARTG